MSIEIDPARRLRPSGHSAVPGRPPDVGPTGEQGVTISDVFAAFLAAAALCAFLAWLAGLI